MSVWVRHRGQSKKNSRMHVKRQPRKIRKAKSMMKDYGRRKKTSAAGKGRGEGEGRLKSETRPLTEGERKKLGGGTSWENLSRGGGMIDDSAIPKKKRRGVKCVDEKKRKRRSWLGK